MEKTYDRGNISESILLQAYLKAGFIVSIPFGSGAPYDLLVDTGTHTYKIQVKTGWHNRGRLLYKGRRRIKDSNRNGTRRYRLDEVDYFAVYDPQNDRIYVIPPQDMGVDGCLRIESALNGQQRFIRWAHDYTWEQHVGKLRSETAPA
ncbi:MAG TPA: group I intron-associated PD-(D/E)XK endonuclease [Blastocatellia bacterium]|jgi:hypothetical protein